MRKLLTVEAVFNIANRGVIAEVGPALDTFGIDGRSHKCEVEIRRPDGSSLIARAEFHMAHLHGHGWDNRYTCMLMGIEKSIVPVGSEIWETERP